MRTYVAVAFVIGIGIGPTFSGRVFATEYTAYMGAIASGGGCTTFTDPQSHKLVEGDTLKIIIENKCGRAWNIRIDRTPNDSFAGDCQSFGATRFKFEKWNGFAEQNDKRGVSCLVKDSHKEGTYKFEVSESSPSASKPRPGLTHGLAVEVDP